MASQKEKLNINNLFIIGGIVLVVIVAAVYFLNQTPFGPKSNTSTREATEITIEEETRAPSGTFEFRDTNYNEVADPSQASIIIVSAPGAQDVRPIDVTVRVKGKEVGKATILIDEPNCGDLNTCSIPVPPSWQGIYDEEGYEILATDAAGNLLALFANLGR